MVRASSCGVATKFVENVPLKSRARGLEYESHVATRCAKAPSINIDHKKCTDVVDNPAVHLIEQINLHWTARAFDEHELVIRV